MLAFCGANHVSEIFMNNPSARLNQTHRSIDAAAWRAVFASDPGELDRSLALGADPNAIHATAGHSLLAQAVKSPSKASDMAAVLIHRGADAPQTNSPLAFELTWRALMEDSVMLAKALMDASQAWSAHFIVEKDKLQTQQPTRLDMLFQAQDALGAIQRFNAHFSPTTRQINPAAQALRPGM